ncbi:uncharacterized protein BXZ73DRAFT_6538, partial [Epithele typhae]|uniref:uncharacterized protein n=1 Tax=Epithele typhae TaxID=378194 RepID=UPI00200736B6
PTPNLDRNKVARGRKVPVQGSDAAIGRRFVCPVEECSKAFTKRAHLFRHMESLHAAPDPFRAPVCSMPFCDKVSLREDNHKTHTERHRLYQEIFLCTGEDNFKGTHIINATADIWDKVNLKPFAAMEITPLILDSWLYKERQRREFPDDPRFAHSEYSWADKYFLAHPEEAEYFLSFPLGHDWKWQFPGWNKKEFRREGSNCLMGKFKLDI